MYVEHQINTRAQQNFEKELLERFGKETVESWRREFQNATIQNDFVFCKTMQKLKLCAEVLRLFLQDVIKIKSISPQSTIDNFLKSKAVRLDVLVEDYEGNHYDLEMQVVSRDSIAKRMRMYQASIDVSTFEKGKDYKDAKKTIIIFICISDPIGKGLPIYTFKNLCVEKPSIALDDDTIKIIVAPQNWEKVVGNNALKALLKYLWDGSKTDKFTEELDMQVKDIKYDRVISNDSLSYYFKMHDVKKIGIEEGMQKGMKKGRQEGRQETARKMKSKDCDIAFIAEITGLTREEIERL